jgi:hypothetical protein
VRFEVFAAAYLSGPAGYTLNAKFVRGLRYLDIGPLAEKRGPQDGWAPDQAK